MTGRGVDDTTKREESLNERTSKTAASLRFFGDDLNPEEVTQLLGKEPDKAERRGEVRPSGYTVRRGRWSVSAGRRTPGDLDSQIAELLAGMTDDLAVWQRLTSVYQADIFCGLFLEQENEGISLSPTTLQLLGERGIELRWISMLLMKTKSRRGGGGRRYSGLSRASTSSRRGKKEDADGRDK
jgi:hypothetical protein